MNKPYEFDESSANEPILSEAGQKAFEDQLRSVRPTPPCRDWSELKSRLYQEVGEPSSDALDRGRTSRSLTAAPPRSWRSHVAVGLVGMLSGAAAMFLLLNAIGWRMEPGGDGGQVAHVDASQEKRVAPDGAQVAANSSVEPGADAMAVPNPAEKNRIASAESPTRPPRDSRHQLQRDRLDAIVQSIFDRDATYPPLTAGYGIVHLEPGTHRRLDPRNPVIERQHPRIRRSETNQETLRSASELLQEYLEDFNAGNRFSTTM